MRIVFLGTPSFAIPTFKKLLDHKYEICAVFTQPDKPSGRGHKLVPSPVKTAALTAGIPIFQPEKIRMEDNRKTFYDLAPDIIVVVAYGQILPGWLLQSARLASINIHASLLPRYRGAAPISWAVINGEPVTGVTTMMMTEKLDAGPILMQQEIPIPMRMTAGELSNNLAELGSDLLIRTIKELESNTLKPVKQDESIVTWAPRISKEIARISWEQSAVDIHNKIRGMNPWPVAYCDYKEGRLHLLRSFPESLAQNLISLPGTFLGLTQDGIRVQCGKGTILEILEVKMPAKAAVTGREFANGARLREGELLFQ